jgi:hypothetical protein
MTSLALACVITFLLPSCRKTSLFNRFSIANRHIVCGMADTTPVCASRRRFSQNWLFGWPGSRKTLTLSPSHLATLAKSLLCALFCHTPTRMGGKQQSLMTSFGMHKQNVSEAMVACVYGCMCACVFVVESL